MASLKFKQVKKYQHLWVVLFFVVAACKERFSPPETDTNLNYLTVEGFINTGGADSTIVKLSRTVKLTNSVLLQPELRASVSIQSNDNLINRSLLEKGNGTYYSVPYYLDPAKKYRLRIKTAGGKEYVSDYAEVKVSPPIDEVKFAEQSTGVAGVQISASTHDAANKSRYYKWDYVETYQYNSNNLSSFIVENFKTIRQRNFPAEDIYNCWRSIYSNNVILASTAKLTSDVVADAPIQKIPPRNERLGIRYSIMVNQQVLTKEAFDFWEILKKNTEQVGSIFDAQPSQLQGNIHSVSNASEVVIGFISAGTVQHKRIFIDATQISREFAYARPLACPVDTVLPKDYATYFFSNTSSLIPVEGITSESSPDPIAYTTAATSCVDCRLRGSNVKPSFWQ